ncbi:uncharacterized protein LOC132709480 [Pantherophis guttatus]|uniref:Uncharacterized protein LOC132709480 n=1 Tax=Pantherophis guttatus TaxID=94885 RepID=A0ABM3YSW9_PANGU|nr:uncharacterized protein LOC132709480 [Pantherophis guttatus]
MPSKITCERSSPVVTRGLQRRRTSQQPQSESTMENIEGGFHPATPWQPEATQMQQEIPGAEPGNVGEGFFSTDEEGAEGPDESLDRQVAEMSEEECRAALASLLKTRAAARKRPEEAAPEMPAIPVRTPLPDLSKMAPAARETAPPPSFPPNKMAARPLPEATSSKMAAPLGTLPAPRARPSPAPQPRPTTPASQFSLPAAQRTTPNPQAPRQALPAMANIKEAIEALVAALELMEQPPTGPPEAPDPAAHSRRAPNPTSHPRRNPDGPAASHPPLQRRSPFTECSREAPAEASAPFRPCWDDPELQSCSSDGEEEIQRHFQAYPAHGPHLMGLQSPERSPGLLPTPPRLPHHIADVRAYSEAPARPDFRAQRGRSELQQEKALEHAPFPARAQLLQTTEGLQKGARPKQSIPGLGIPMPFTTGSFQPFEQLPMQFNGNNFVTLPNNFEKLHLSGQNFKKWCKEIQIILLRENTLDMIKRPPPLPWSPEIEFLHKRAYTTLLSSIDTALYASLSDGLTAQEVWTALYNLFHSDNMAATSRLSRRFHNYKLKPGVKMGEHLAMLKAMRDELIQRGEPVSESTLISVMLNSLDKSWSPFIISLEGVSREQRNIEYFSGRFIEEDLRRRDEEQQEMKEAYHRPRPQRRRQDTSERINTLPTCFDCGMQGHFKRECPRSRANTAGLKHNKNKRGRGRGGGGHKGYQFCSVTSDNHISQIKDAEGLWLLDSGASTHIANTNQQFKVLHPLKSSVKVATGDKAEVTGEGVINVPGIGDVTGALYVPSIKNNLLSILKLTEDKNVKLVFEKGGGYVFKNGGVVGDIVKISNLPYFSPKAQVKRHKKPNKRAQGANAQIEQKASVPAPGCPNSRTLDLKPMKLLNQLLGHPKPLRLSPLRSQLLSQP